MFDKIDITVNYNGIEEILSLTRNTKFGDFKEIGRCDLNWKPKKVINPKKRTILFTAVTTFGISPEASERIEVTGSDGCLLNEESFEMFMQTGNSRVVSVRVVWEPETASREEFVFDVPEPFGSYSQNLFNQKATPVFRQNCFMFEAISKPSKVFNRFPKKLTPKRLSRNRSLRIWSLHVFSTQQAHLYKTLWNYLF